MSSRPKKTRPPTSPSPDLRQRVLEDFQTLRIPLAADELDTALARAEKERSSALELLAHVLGPQADLRRQRAIERRIREARFREPVASKASIGSSTRRPSTAGRSKPWPPASSSAEGTTWSCGPKWRRKEPHRAIGGTSRLRAWLPRPLYDQRRLAAAT